MAIVQDCQCCSSVQQDPSFFFSFKDLQTDHTNKKRMLYNKSAGYKHTYYLLASILFSHMINSLENVRVPKVLREITCQTF